jgi:hypothetical protein
MATSRPICGVKPGSSPTTKGLGPLIVCSQKSPWMLTLRGGAPSARHAEARETPAGGRVPAAAALDNGERVVTPPDVRTSERRRLSADK